jgi:tetratricopeptide (TPR) repeat protein
MTLRPLLCLWLAALITASGLAFGQPSQTTPAPLSRDWKRIRGEAFTVIGDGTDEQLRAAVMELERFRVVLKMLLPAARFTSPVPTVLVLFRDARAMTPFKPRDERGKIIEDVAGYFSMHPEVNQMVSAVYPDRFDTLGVLFHEYAHYIIHSTGEAIPTWVDEGMAEFLGTFRTDGPATGILGSVPPWRAARLASNEPLLSFEELFTAEGVTKAFGNEVQVQRLYAQAWGLVHYMTVGKRAGQLGQYLQALAKGRTPREAFQDAFNVSFEVLQREMRAYMRQPALPAARITLPATLAADKAPIERLSEVDALSTQAQVLMRAGAADESEALVQRALKLDASHVGARLSLAAIQRHRRQWNEAVTTMKSIAGDAPREFAAQYYLSVDLTTEGRHEEAMEAANASVTLNGGSPDAWLQLSVAALALGRTSQADAALARATSLYRSANWPLTRAHRLWWIGNDSGVVQDVNAYASSVGWNQEGVAYATFLAALSYTRLGQPQQAKTIIERAAGGIASDSWTAVVAQFLRGDLAASAFLNRAKGIGQETEAHAYIGILAAIAGRRDEAMSHLQWVEERGSRSYSEYGLALAELNRLRARGAREGQ